MIKICEMDLRRSRMDRLLSDPVESIASATFTKPPMFAPDIVDVVTRAIVGYRLGVGP